MQAIELSTTQPPLESLKKAALIHLSPALNKK